MDRFNELLAEIHQRFEELEKLSAENQKRRQIVLAERIKHYRMANNLTQTELAKKLYVTKMCVIRWEKGEVMPIESNFVRFRELGIIEK